MGRAEHHVAPAIGPSAEKLLRRTFKSTLLITASTAAEILGLDVKTLKAMTEDGLIRHVRRGSLRAYTEADIRGIR